MIDHNGYIVHFVYGFDYSDNVNQSLHPITVHGKYLQLFMLCVGRVLQGADFSSV
jgi:hypothetical protein